MKGILKRNNVRLLAITPRRQSLLLQESVKKKSVASAWNPWRDAQISVPHTGNTFLEGSSFPRSSLIIICDEKEFHLPAMKIKFISNH